VEKLLLPVPDAARLVGIGRTSMYGLLGAGEIKSVCINRRRLVVAESLREYVDRLVLASSPTSSAVTP
jgi:hypothetical protein